MSDDEKVLHNMTDDEVRAELEAAGFAQGAMAPPSNVVDLADFREVPGSVWVNYKARCTSCGHEHIATQEMPEWAKAPTSAQCPACSLRHSCLPMEWLP